MSEPFKLEKNTPERIIQIAGTIKSKSNIYGPNINIFEGYQRSKIQINPQLFQTHKLYMEVMPYIQLWLIDSFSAKIFEPCHRIMKLLCRIDFFSLKLIDLSGNSIDTIEPLSWLKAPKLQYLNISYNRISSLRSMKKCVFKSLKNLDIGQNIIGHVELERLVRCQLPFCMSEIKLSGKDLQRQSLVNKNFQYGCFEQIFKFKQRQINSLTIKSTFLVVKLQNAYLKLSDHKLKSWNNILLYRNV